jgi:hypothetical protein
MYVSSITGVVIDFTSLVQAFRRGNPTSLQLRRTRPFGASAKEGLRRTGHKKRANKFTAALLHAVCEPSQFSAIFRCFGRFQRGKCAAGRVMAGRLWRPFSASTSVPSDPFSERLFNSRIRLNIGKIFKLHILHLTKIEPEHQRNQRGRCAAGRVMIGRRWISPPLLTSLSVPCDGKITEIIKKLTITKIKLVLIRFLNNMLIHTSTQILKVIKCHYSKQQQMRERTS